MRAPAFWWKTAPDALALLLSPLGAAYGAATARRMARPGTRVGAPVICVGNFVAGGAGKTPTAIALAKALQEIGETPFFLTRGYGAREPVTTPLRVDPGQHDSQRVGDEPLLLARAAPTIVSPDRVAGARFAIAEGASVLVMDDGLQNPSLHKDFSIAVVDGAAGVGNGLCVPAGPLRAPLAAQTPFIDAALVIGEPRPGLALPGSLQIVAATLEPERSAVAALKGQRVFAFAGIGRPEKFFDTLRAAGAIVVGTQAFADHHPFSAAELALLAEQARRHGARLVTTEKDLVRLPAGADIAALPVTLLTDPADAMSALAAAALAKAASRG
jgi:tetraacyldisaccharide 4'-kinase